MEIKQITTAIDSNFSHVVAGGVLVTTWWGSYIDTGVKLITAAYFLVMIYGTVQKIIERHRRRKLDKMKEIK